MFGINSGSILSSPLSKAFARMPLDETCLLYFAEFLVAYSSPVGMKLGKSDFTDRSYDGIYSNKTKMLLNGLGDLVDDHYGSNDLKTGWVGFNLSRIMLTFEFSKEQSFSSVALGIRTLARTENPLERFEVSASSDGRHFAHVRTHSRVMKDDSGDKMIVDINVYSARYIKCILTTKNNKDILLISEVSFSKGMCVYTYIFNETNKQKSKLVSS